METVLGILGIVALVVVGGEAVAIIVLALKNSGRADQLLAARDVIDGHIAENERLADDRDAEKAARVKAEAERDALKTQLVATQAQDATKAEKEAEHAADEIRNAADPGDAVDRLLADSARVPDPPTAPAGAGDGAPSKPAL